VKLAHHSDAEERAYILADNRLAEKAGWAGGRNGSIPSFGHAEGSCQNPAKGKVTGA
jgi:hypothetical protein